ncbi:MAG: hypothetical protein FWD73_17620 [Polyangiaceae bacterium]|nr:hypothetical protein [Polyangiaceae bacterium]
MKHAWLGTLVGVVIAAVPACSSKSKSKSNDSVSSTVCGGASNTPCPGGHECSSDDDCDGFCVSGTCTAPSATDGKQNQGETDIDCGGPNAPGCTFGKVCVQNSDCLAQACTDSVCVEPTATDGVKNGGESDIDCGGSGVTDGDFSYKVPRCKDEQKCVVAGDCWPGSACSPAGTCASPSCGTSRTAGITTCGAGETVDANAVHDSCCKSLSLPTRPGRLDKYEITSGRFRTFLDAVGPDVQSWVKQYVSTHSGSQLATLTNMDSDLLNIYPSVQTDLTQHMSNSIDSYEGSRGCYNQPGDYGANTYWLDQSLLNDAYKDSPPTRVLLQSVSDEKPLNCAMPIMFAAFCAWDGDGRLAMVADYQDVWNPSQTYPWGNSNLCTDDKPPAASITTCANKNNLDPSTVCKDDLGPPDYTTWACNQYNWCNGNRDTGTFTCQNTNYNAYGVAGIFYMYPANTNLADDSEALIAAPGRFVKDASSTKGFGESWMDLYANLMEYTGDFNKDCDDRFGHPCTFYDYSGIPTTPLVGSSWEGHLSGVENGGYRYPVTFQYGKIGARCVRDMQKP